VRFLWRQTRIEFLMLWRNPASLVFAILFPLLLLVVLAEVFGSTGFVGTAQGEVDFISFYVPGVVTLAAVQSCFSSLATSLTFRRETGILKRKHGTPLPAWALVGGLVLAECALALLLTVATIGVGMAGWDLAFPKHPVAVLEVVALSAACFCALGIAVATFIPNEDSAPAVINAVAFPLLFISGVWFVDHGIVRRVSRFFPIARMRDAVADAFGSAAHSCTVVKGACGGVDHVSHSGGPYLIDLAVIAGWLLLGLLVAIWCFRWEPHRH